ncbi:hypothetical protein AMK59_7816 [Oryctes borbonicus]|uniref:A-kinase anchor protein 7-like phosphoesterase domain-containing protein n=1 Tax=Oryctes borbonicus TaxID=1629725 RepID=A0A0T6ATQ5_9SCAR|nr:hypothetical protein AMK59_7816 [Oryctes borbonicus]
MSKAKPLRITVSGLDCMNNNYKKVNVLYAKAKISTENEEDVLQSMLNSISKLFYETGFIRQYRENVKIHLTLMNTKYRKSNDRQRKWTNRRQPFDASIIMEKYKDFHFGECDLKEIYLSWISEIGDNGFYKPLSVITI